MVRTNRNFLQCISA